MKSRPKTAATNSSRLRRAGLLAAPIAVAAFILGCRLDMHQQPKYKPLAETAFFDDQRSERPVVEGTVARGELRIDEQLYTGKVNGVDAETFPFPIAKADLERGRERFEIYCSPCHDYAGTGHGMIVQRGFPPPPSLHIDRLRQAPPGHFFDVMTNGLGNMYSYAARVTPEDRWRIAAYIRALQLSQNDTIEDVPEKVRQHLQTSGTPLRVEAGVRVIEPSPAGETK